MPILVTAGACFLGSQVADAALDNLAAGKRDVSKGAWPYEAYEAKELT